MIVTPQAQITPKLEVARLTMLSTYTEEHLRRASVLSDSKPNLSNLKTDDAPGPLSPVDAIIVESPLHEIKPENANAAKTSTQEVDGSSETTLVETSMEDRMDVDTQKGQVTIHEDKENVSPTRVKFERPRTPDHNLKPLGETSPSRVNQEANDSVANAAAATEDEMEMGESINVAPAPTRPPPIPPRTHSERRTTINEEELYRQQDVTEVIGNVLFQLQCAIKPDEIDASGEQIDLIKKLFYGRMKTTTTDAAGKPRTMEEFFSDLKINVSSGPPDLYNALDSLFDRRMVELGSSEQQHEEAQFSTITTLPAVLQIHPIRTAYDRQRGAYKVDHQFVFDEVIYLDRYMDGGDKETQRKRAQCWEMKDKLKRIEERHVELGKNQLGLTARETLLLTAEYLKQIEAVAGTELLPDVSPTVVDKVQQAAEDVKEELSRLSIEEETLRTDLRAAWADPSFQTLPYQLHAVFIHRGMVSSGHYWVYIFDHPGRLWRKYNDGYVTEVSDPAAEIFGKQPGDRPATPMFFVYVKQAQASELAEVVRRELPPEASSEEEQAMLDAGPRRAATEKVSGNAAVDGQMDAEGGGTLGKGLTW
jgi:ubiquitin carboxyl-terminal hydrolase 25